MTIQILNLSPLHARTAVTFPAMLGMTAKILISLMPLVLSKRAKRKLKKSKQQAEADVVQLVEARFEELNALLLEGSVTQEVLLQLRNRAVEELNDIERQARDLLLL